MKKVTLILLILGVFFLFSFFTLKISPINDLLNRISIYDSTFEKQKIFLHTDKDIYYSGENIYFKSYLLNSNNNEPIIDNSIIYIEILNPKNEIIIQQIIKNQLNLSNGTIFLPDTITSGTYSIRGFTDIMKNFPQSFFTKKIEIINSENRIFYSRYLKKKYKNLKKKSSDLFFEFYPEGGSFALNKNNLTVLNCFDISGTGKKVFVSIIDENNKFITQFQTSETGYGSFILKPETNVKYYADIKYNNKKIKKIQIPIASENAYSMCIKDSLLNLYITINSNNEINSQNRLYKILLVGRKLGKTIYNNVENINQNSVTFKISKKDIPQGITSFTAFSDNGKLIAERMYFKPISDNFKVKIEHNIVKDSIYLSLYLSDSTVSLSSSLSIEYSESILSNSNNPNICEYLHFNSEFNENNGKSSSFSYNGSFYSYNDLDLAMITQSRKEFGNLFDQGIKTNFKPQFKKNSLLTVSGKCIHGMIKYPAKDIKVSMYILNKHNDRYVTNTDETGSFSFNNLNYNDTIDVLIEARNNNGGKLFIIQLDKNDTFPLNESFANQNFEEAFKNQKIAEKYYFKNFSKSKIQDTFHNNQKSIHNFASNIIDFNTINTEGYSNVLQVLSAYVPGISEYGDSQLRGRNSITQSTEPLYLIDDIPTDKNAMLSTSPEIVERVEILKSPGNTAIYGGRGSNGVIAVYTKKGYYVSHGKIRFQMLGFSPSKFFVVPKEEFINKKLYTTIYWNPNFTNENEFEKEISLKTIGKGFYRVVLQGISSKGNPIFKEYSFEIR